MPILSKKQNAASEDEIDVIAWCMLWSYQVGAFRLVLLVQPSSAAVERVFLILQHFIAQQQSSLEGYLSSLEGYLELLSLLCYNTTQLIRFTNNSALSLPNCNLLLPNSNFVAIE